MKNAFNFEGPIFSGLSRLADLIWLNLLFIVCSLPIVTIGASATAMYYVTLKMARDEEGYITKSFFKSFKQNFKQGTGIWLILLVVILVLLFDFRFVTNDAYAAMISTEAVKNVLMVATMAVGVIWVFIYLYVFPILARFENSVKNTIRNAFFMSIRHLPKTLLMIVIYIVPVVLMYFFNTAMLLVFIMFSAIAYFCSKMFVKIFDLYTPKEDDAEEVADEEFMAEEVAAEEVMTEEVIAEEIAAEPVDSQEGNDEEKE